MPYNETKIAVKEKAARSFVLILLKIMTEKREKTKQVTESSWQEDIETHRYYYDDAYGYEKYEPETADEFDEADESDETSPQEE